MENTMGALGAWFKRLKPEEQDSADKQVDEMIANGMSKEQAIDELAQKVTPEAREKDIAAAKNSEQGWGDKVSRGVGIFAGALQDISGKHGTGNTQKMSGEWDNREKKRVDEVKEKHKTLDDYLQNKRAGLKETADTLKEDKKWEVSEGRKQKDEVRKEEDQTYKVMEKKREAEEYLRTKDLNNKMDDPASQVSAAYRELAKQFKPSDAMNFDNMSATEMVAIIDPLQEKYKADKQLIKDGVRDKLAEARLTESKLTREAVATRSKVGAQKDLSDKLKPTQDVVISLDMVERDMGISFDDYLAKLELYKAGKGPEPDAPGFNFFGRKAIPFSDSKNLQAAVQEFANQKLKMMSGAAVSDQEAVRALQALASGKWNTEEQLIRALQRTKSSMVQGMQNIEGRLPDSYRDVLQEYEANGGMTSNRYPQYRKAPIGVMMVSPSGKEGTVPANQTKEAEDNGWVRK